MTPQLFTGKNVIIQGITGKNGRFHTRNMLDYKTHIVAGTSPNQAISEVHGVPVFRTIDDIKKRFAIDISVIFVPAPHAKAAILEAIQAQIPLIICITEGVPVHDMLEIKQKLHRSRSVLIGPNCPGVLLPDRQLLGIIPTSLAAGLAVFVNAWARMNHIDLFANFYVNFSIVTSLILVVIGLLLSFGLLQIVYSKKKKSLEELLNRSLEQPDYYKIKPVNSSHFYIKMLLLRLCFFALTLIFALAFIYIKNVAMLLIMILTMFIFLATINVAFASGEEREYEIVEVKSNQSKN